MNSKQLPAEQSAGRIAAEDEREKLEHLRRFLNVGISGMAAGWLLTFVLFILYSGLFTFLLQGTLLVYLVLMVVARKWTLQGRLQPAVNLVAIGAWQTSIAMAFGGANYTSAAVMVGLLAFVVAAPYLSMPKLRVVGLISCLVMAVAPVLVVANFSMSLDALPAVWVDWVGVYVSPSIAVTAIAALWQTRLVLNDSNDRITKANEALIESERLLEQKVAERTAALEQSRSDLTSAHSAAVEANQHKSAFLANMSHELRTPLNAVIGFSEVLVERVFGELNDKQEEYLKDIHASGRHLLALINDILDLSKIEAGRLELSLSTFEVPTVIEDSLVLMRERAHDGGVALTEEIDQDVGAIVGDERKLKQVLLNLLTNAVKFTKEGGTVTVKAHREGEEMEISVTDTGIGIAPENHELVFEEFRQTSDDYSRAQEGTGLGLALTKRLVELHGGRIWLDSELGRGSTFAVRIPLQAAATDPAAS